MDDFEKAILFSFDQTGAVDAQLKAQAQAYCQQIKQSSNVLRLCLERFSSSQYAEVQFWCLQVLEEVVRTQYGALSAADKATLRSTLLAAVCDQQSPEGSMQNAAGQAAAGAAGGGQAGGGGSSLSQQSMLSRPVFTRNKVAQIVVMLIYADYPAEWPTAFLSMLAALGGGPGAVDMVLRVLARLDEEVISLDYPRTQEESGVAMRIKDAMRQQCIGQLADAWYSLAVGYDSAAQPEVSAAVLETMRGYIAWIDIGLVANDRWIPLLFRLLADSAELPRLRGAAADCLLAVVSKRMDGMAKLALLQQLQMSQICRGGLPEVKDADFALKLTGLLTGLAAELLECCRRVDEAAAAAEAAAAGEAVRGMLDEVLPAVFFLMEHDDEEISATTFQFLLAYVDRIKRGARLSANQAGHLARILSIIRSRMRYAAHFEQALDGDGSGGGGPSPEGQAEEARMCEYRRDLFTLLKNIARVAPDVTRAFVQSTLSAALADPDAPFADVEAALSLFYQLGEGVTEDVLRPGGGLMGEMAGALLAAAPPAHARHRAVALALLESVTRYVRFVEQHPQYVPAVLGIALGDRGVHHASAGVRNRACYLLMRIVKVLRAHMLPYVENILQSLQDTMAAVATPVALAAKAGGKPEGFDERIYIFEAVGLLIGQEEVAAEKQAEYVSAILAPLCAQVDAVLAKDVPGGDQVGSPEAVWALQQVILAISYLSKGFGEQLITNSRPELGALFKQALDMVLRVLQTLPKNKPLRSRIISFLHRMVETLGSTVFPYLPTAIRQLLHECEVRDMVEFLQLMNQLMARFKAAMAAILAEVLPDLVARTLALLPSSSSSAALPPDGVASHTEEVREQRELQRMYVSFLHTVTITSLTPVLLAPQSLQTLTLVITSMLEICSSCPDMLLRKTCMGVFIKFISEWCPEPEKVVGFRRFVIERFAAECCLYAILRPSFNLRDANTFALLGEIAAAQKVVAEKCGEEFLVHWANVVLPSVHCPPNTAEQYCLHLQRADLKTLKMVLEALVAQLRPLQNGNVAQQGPGPGQSYG